MNVTFEDLTGTRERPLLCKGCGETVDLKGMAAHSAWHRAQDQRQGFGWKAILRDSLVAVAAGALAATIVFFPQLLSAQHEAASSHQFVTDLKAEFAQHCKVNPADGSALCAPGTFPPAVAK